MTLKEFYTEINGDYEDAYQRLLSNELIIRCINKFAIDNTYPVLMEAISKQDLTAAFEASHKLK